MEKNDVESQSPTNGDVERESGFFRCCVICACLLIVAAAGIAGIVFAVRADDSHNVRVYVQDLYVPSLVNNKTATFNTSVFVHLTFKRHETLIRHSYGDFTMILSYGEYRSRSIPVGSRTVDGFSMGHKKRVDVKAVVEATEMPWEAVFRKVSVENVAMVVELKIKNKKINPMGSASDELPLVARVKVDDSGHMVERPILLEEWNPRWNV